MHGAPGLVTLRPPPLFAAAPLPSRRDAHGRPQTHYNNYWFLSSVHVGLNASHYENANFNVHILLSISVVVLDMSLVSLFVRK